jgi:two-component system chemotaxis response regulator CheB
MQSRCALPVREVGDKDPIEPGIVYVAPSDYHLLVDEGEFGLTLEGPVRFSRPSIDVLFESAADAYGPQLIGVVLTGSNEDGARGAKRIKERGGLVVVQDPATAEAPEMPAAVAAMVKVDRILPLEAIASFLSDVCGAPVSKK